MGSPGAVPFLKLFCSFFLHLPLPPLACLLRGLTAERTGAHGHTGTRARFLLPSFLSHTTLIHRHDAATCTNAINRQAGVSTTTTSTGDQQGIKHNNRHTPQLHYTTLHTTQLAICSITLPHGVPPPPSICRITSREGGR